MNKLIRAELKKVNIAKIPDEVDNITELYIPRFKQIKLEEDSYYLIKLDDSLMNPNEMSTLAANWNHGTVPPYKYMKADVSRIVGKMILVTGLGHNYDTGADLDNTWTGWLPIDRIEVIKKL